VGNPHFEFLCRPGKIGPIELKNRMVMAPHSPNSAGTNGEVTDLFIDYFEARARGGAGLLIIEDTLVVPACEWGEAISHQPEIWDRRLVDGWKRLTDAIHFWGAKVAVQLNWVGIRIDPKLWPNVQPTAPSIIEVPGWTSVQKKTIAPTAAHNFHTSRAVTLEETIWLEDQFALSAACARDAGFDMVMLHGTQGYGIASFTSPYCNKRNDLYGESFENRMRFSRNIITKVRKELTSNMALIVRASVDEFLPGSADRKECVRIVQAYEKAGIDAIHLSCGLFSTQETIQPIYKPRAYLEPYLKDFRRAVQVPLSVAGSFNHPEDAERILREYKLDFIDFARPLIVDPEYPNKVMEGRPEDIRVCTRCGECINSIVANYTGLDCSLNVEAGKEAKLKIRPAKKSKKILVVGGGISGMEAARVAAMRGHKVTLWEKNDKLGGNLIPASVPAFKIEYKWLIDWYVRQLDKLGIELKLCNAATQNNVANFGPDVAIVAIGSELIIPEYAAKSDKSVTAIDVLIGKARVGEQVVIAGGGLIGAETALYLAEMGKTVMIVEQLGEIAADTLIINQKALLPNLKKNNVRWVTNKKITAINDKGVVAVDMLNGDTISYSADSVVFAVGRKPIKGFVETLKDRVPEVYAVGDCVKPRRVKEAVWEGAMIARRI